MAAVGWVVIAVTIAACATVALVTGHISSDQWLSTVGPAGAVGAYGAHLAGKP